MILSTARINSDSENKREGSKLNPIPITVLQLSGFRRRLFRRWGKSKDQSATINKAELHSKSHGGPQLDAKQIANDTSL